MKRESTCRRCKTPMTSREAMQISDTLRENGISQRVARACFPTCGTCAVEMLRRFLADGTRGHFYG